MTRCTTWQHEQMFRAEKRIVRKRLLGVLEARIAQLGYKICPYCLEYVHVNKDVEQCLYKQQLDAFRWPVEG